MKAYEKKCRDKNRPCFYHKENEPCDNCISIEEQILNKYLEKPEEKNIITANYQLLKDAISEAIEYGESLSRDRAVKEEEFRSTLIELIKWNDKYPPGKIYDYGRANTIEKQLTAIVDRAKEFISPIETKEQ